MRSRSLDQAINATGLGVPGRDKVGLKRVFHKLVILLGSPSSRFPFSETFA